MNIPFATASAAEKQVDQLQNLANVSVIAAIVIILADFAAEQNVSFLGLKAELSGAYAIAGWAFLIVSLLMSQLFARLADIVALSDEDEVWKVLGTLFSHRWSLNPFSYFGVRPIAILHTSAGIGLLIFQWWLGMLALSLLWDRLSIRTGSTAVWFRVGYIVAGLLAFVALLRVQRAIHLRLAALHAISDDPDVLEVRQHVRRAFAFKIGIGIVLAGLGCWTYYVFTHIGM